MSDTLLSAVSRYAERFSGPSGVAPTPVPGLTTIRAVNPSDLVYAVSRPIACLVVQGAKRVSMGSHAVSFGAGDSLLITADVPTVSEITRATVGEPYLSLVLDLDPAIIAELSVEMKLGPVVVTPPVQADTTDAEVADAALRLMRLLERPQSVPILQNQLLREMHYWLLAGRHGPAIRRLGWPDGHVRRIARAVAVIRSDYTKTIPVESLAAIAGMSPSSFHEHFRAVTSLSPLQFQKQLRLIEARRLMVAEGVSASNAAYAVGYESVSQFTREYGRMFGASPVKDVQAARRREIAA